MIIGYSGKDSALAKSFILQYKKKLKFKCFKFDINNKKQFRLWLSRNKNINVFINFAAKFFCMIESSICVPIVLGSSAIETPVPKTPVEEYPTQPDKIINIKNKKKFLIIIF